MKNEIIFLKPVFKEMIWGGDRLKEFGYDIPGDKTGECWAISAHPNGDCVAQGYGGMTLSELWEKHGELFGETKSDRFPLLIKIIDANDDLSIQVHPDDEYAMKNENGSFGKTECWYVLDCKDDATIVIGHNAKDKEELKDMIEACRWSEFIREVPIKKGDFFQIDPGCLHAIKGGTLILETQQNSDITYRVYDYDRLQNGKPRQLHVQESIDVIKTPFENAEPERSVVVEGNIKRERLVSCEYYTVEKLDICGEAELKMPYGFMNVSVIEGAGEIDGKPIKKGSHFIIPNGYDVAKVSGELSVIVSFV